MTKAQIKATKMYNDNLKNLRGLFKKRRAKTKTLDQINTNIKTNDSKFVITFWERVKKSAETI